MQELKPTLRFDGFDDVWEQRKLGEMGTSYGGLTGKSKEDFGHGDAKFVPYTNVFDNPIADPSRLGDVEVDSSQNRVQCGDALFTVSSETPEEVGMSSVWLADLDNLYLNSFCFGYRQDGSFDPYYLAFMLRSNSVREGIELLAQGISRFNISKNKVMEVEVPVPAMSEQRQIGAFFYQLDNLITLHQREYDKLLTTKQSLLQKMFPKAGETEPELRFEGFEGPWESKKLGELGEFNPKSSLPESFEYVDLESVVGTEMVGHRREERATAPSRAQRLAQAGDIFYQTVRPYQKNNYLYELPDDDYVFSTGYAQIRPLIDPSFLFCLLQQDSFVGEVLDNCTGTSYPAINASDLADIEVSTPASIDEQRLIGRSFASLDNLVSLRAQELEKLKQIKSGLLQRMFV